jgi:hypothetical protein
VLCPVEPGRACCQSNDAACHYAHPGGLTAIRRRVPPLPARRPRVPCAGLRRRWRAGPPGQRAGQHDTQRRCEPPACTSRKEYRLSVAARSALCRAFLGSAALLALNVALNASAIPRQHALQRPWVGPQRPGESRPASGGALSGLIDAVPPAGLPGQHHLALQLSWYVHDPYPPHLARTLWTASCTGHRLDACCGWGCWQLGRQVTQTLTQPYE